MRIVKYLVYCVKHPFRPTDILLLERITQSTNQHKESHLMKRLISITSVGLLTLPGLLSAGLYVTPISNGDFEAQLGTDVGTGGTGVSGNANFDPRVDDWFDKNGEVAGDGDFVQWEGANSNIPADVNGEVWGGVGADAGQDPGFPGALYQDIGTFDANLELTISFTAGDRSNKFFPDVTVSLYSGSVSGADGTDLASLSVTLLDSTTVTSASLWANDAADGSVSPQTAPVSLNLNTGTSGVSGDTLWLEFRYAGPLAASDIPGDYQALIDDVSVVPEPSTFALMAGVLTLGLVLLRRRRA